MNTNKGIIKFIHIGSHNDHIVKIAEVNKCISSGYDVFVLVYLEGCGPCNLTRPEWAKLESTLSSQYANKKVAIVDVDSKFYQNIHGIGRVEGFPTIKHIKHKKVQTFENSGIKCTDRTSDCFVSWIDSKIHVVYSTHNNSTSKKHMIGGTRHRRRGRRGRRRTKVHHNKTSRN